MTDAQERELRDLNDIIQAMEQFVEIQSRPGTYDVDPYMYGMANGMIFMLSVATGKTPKYLEAPEAWADMAFVQHGEVFSWKDKPSPDAVTGS